VDAQTAARVRGLEDPKQPPRRRRLISCVAILIRLIIRHHRLISGVVIIIRFAIICRIAHNSYCPRPPLAPPHPPPHPLLLHPLLLHASDQLITLLRQHKRRREEAKCRRAKPSLHRLDVRAQCRLEGEGVARAHELLQSRGSSHRSL